MKSTDIPEVPGQTRACYSLRDLLRRAASSDRASWTDISERSGIYVVYCNATTALRFSESAGRAIDADPKSAACLQAKWERISNKAPTDIVYVGKGNNLRKRVRQLARFGVGRAKNHKGGEWMWQMKQLDSAHVLTQVCPKGKQKAFEAWLLDEFRRAHGDWPLANREGGTGTDRWDPRHG